MLVSCSKDPSSRAAPLSSDRLSIRLKTNIKSKIVRIKIVYGVYDGIVPKWSNYWKTRPTMICGAYATP